MNPLDLLPFLIECGDIAFNYLRERLLSEDQIEAYLDYMCSPEVTIGQTRKKIVQEDGHPDEIFLAIESLCRINSLCNTIECPSEEPVHPQHATIAAFNIFRAGVIIGGLIGVEEKQELYSEMMEKLFPLAEHGSKFVENKGKHVDAFTHYLVDLFQSYYNSNGRYPSNKEVRSILEQEAEQGFIHTANDEVIEWEGGSLQIDTLPNRLTRIRKIIGIKKSR